MHSHRGSSIGAALALEIFRSSKSRFKESSRSPASAIGLKQTPIANFLTGYLFTTRKNILIKRVASRNEENLGARAYPQPFLFNY
jgi:hypothetical protein